MEILDLEKHNDLSKYISFFKEINAAKGDLVFKEGEKKGDNNFGIYYIKKGEIRLVCKKNLTQIDNLLKNLGYKELIDLTLPKGCTQLTIDNLGKDFFLKKFRIKLSTAIENDIIGLRELIDGIYICSAEVVSKTAVYYEINSQALSRIIKRNVSIWEHIKEISKNKMKLMVNSLLNIRKRQFELMLDIRSNQIQKEIQSIPSTPIEGFKKTAKRDVKVMNRTFVKSASCGDFRNSLNSILKNKKDQRKKYLNQIPLAIKKEENSDKKIFVTNEIKDPLKPFPNLSKTYITGPKGPKKLKVENKLEIVYDESKYLNKSKSQINLLAYDTFNRRYNTLYYYRYLSGYKLEKSNNFLDFWVNVKETPKKIKYH